MTPRDLLQRLKANADALMKMGALEFATSGRPKARLLVDDLLLFLAHLYNAGSTVETATTEKFLALENRIAELERGQRKPVLQAVHNATKAEVNASGKPTGSG